MTQFYTLLPDNFGSAIRGEKMSVPLPFRAQVSVGGEIDLKLYLTLHTMSKCDKKITQNRSEMKNVHIKKTLKIQFTDLHKLSMSDCF